MEWILVSHWDMWDTSGMTAIVRVPALVEIHVRDMDRETWKAIRSEAVQREVTVAQMLAILWDEWPGRPEWQALYRIEDRRKT